MPFGPGRPRFVPTEQQRADVAAFVAGGIPHDAICRHILKPDGKPITGKTLRRAFRLQIDAGGADANLTVVNAIFVRAKAGDMTAAIWWTKTRMGWRETVVNANMNIPADPEVAHELTRRLVPEFADRGKAQAPGQPNGEATNGAAVHVGVLGTNGATPTNGSA